LAVQDKCVVAPSLLIGLDVPDDCTTQLGIKTATDLTSYLSRPDERGLNGAIVESPDKYPLMPMPEHPNAVLPYEENAAALIKSLLYAVRAREYLGIVVDLPPGFSDWTIEPIQMASMVLLIVEPDPCNVRKVVVGMREVQRYAGIARNKIQLVINKLPPDSPTSTREVQQAIQHGLGWDIPVVATIPYDTTVHEKQLEWRVPVSAAPDSDTVQDCPVLCFARAVVRLAHALYPGLSGAKAHRNASVLDKLVGALRRI